MNPHTQKKKLSTTKKEKNYRESENELKELSHEQTGEVIVSLKMG